MYQRNSTSTKKLVGVGLMTAIVVVLQLLGSFIRFGTFSVSLVLIPIVIGAALFGVGAGAWLGFVFGVAVLLSGDANAFLTVNAIGTVITVLLKGTLAGLAAGFVYEKLASHGSLPATIAAAVVCPIVNTGIFLLGCYLFFYETVAGWGASVGYEDFGTYLIIGFVGLNFVFEMVINMVLSPAVVRITQAVSKGH